jgi:hypothetical protein
MGNSVRRACRAHYFVKVKRWNVITKVSPDELLRMKQIIASGIPLDDAVMENLGASCRGLLVRQTGPFLENMIFDLKYGGTGYILSIAVDNDSTQPLRVEQYRLEQPWPESDFHWLEDPLRKTPRERTYSFPERGPEAFERECVLNHRVGRRGRLLPGDCIEGLLCGVGQARIPDEYHHNQSLSMRLSVLDGRGQKTELLVEFILNREEQIRRHRRIEVFKGRDARMNWVKG